MSFGLLYRQFLASPLRPKFFFIWNKNTKTFYKLTSDIYDRQAIIEARVHEVHLKYIVLWLCFTIKNVSQMVYYK